ncbi:MAG: C10 family peptidase [Candidatus Syntrophosphaera sp.]
MKKTLLCVALILFYALLLAGNVSLEQASEAAGTYLEKLGYQGSCVLDREIGPEPGSAYVFQLAPRGYIVAGGSDELPPVLAWSLQNSFAAGDGDLLAELLEADIALRLEHMDAAAREDNRNLWRNLNPSRDDFQQWPPEGSTFTGGWIKTQWTQNSPYNDLCPIDPVSEQRSVAGCPAVAMAQIVNYYQTINGTAFTDADDYYHSYAGRNFWIDNDHALHGFPSWPQLNGYLADMMQHYKYGQDQTPTDMAALVYACGVAMEQVYSSAGSGTFAVAQAFAGFQRFGFQSMELLTDAAPDLYDRMAQNMMDAQPVHLAVVTPAWDAGHNVVVDGYNTDGFFHLNFGWGGPYSGWYLLPDQIPYNLSVIEGAIVDISPRQYLFALPDTLQFIEWEDVTQPQILEVINISDAPLSVEAIEHVYDPTGLGEVVLSIFPDAANLPQQLQPGQSLMIELWWTFLDKSVRSLIEGSLTIVHSYGVTSVPMLIESSLFTANDDQIQPPAPGILAWPNPFRSRLNLKGCPEEEIEASIYNARGQLVRRLAGTGKLSWEPGPELGSGVYLIRVERAGKLLTRRVLKLK